MTVAEIVCSSDEAASFVPEADVSNASSSIELPASAVSEGTRRLWPFSTTNCFPPALITACDICFILSDESNRHRKVEYYRQPGGKQQPLRLAERPPWLRQRSFVHFAPESSP